MVQQQAQQMHALAAQNAELQRRLSSASKARIDKYGNPKGDKGKSIELFGAKHTSLAKTMPSMRDHATWNEYYNASLGRWVAKAGKITVKGERVPARRVYNDAIAAGDVALSNDKVLNTSTGRVINAPKKGYRSGFLLYKSMADAADAFRKAVVDEEGGFLNKITAEPNHVLKETLIGGSRNILYRKQFDVNIRNLDSVKQFLESAVMREIAAKQVEMRTLVVRIAYGVNFKHLERRITDVSYLTGQRHTILTAADVNALNLYAEFSHALEQRELRGSGWSFSSLKSAIVFVAAFKPPTGSSYVELPEWLANKKAVVNVQNVDNECFAWAITSALFPVDKHAQRVSKYVEARKNLDWSGVSFPMAVDKIGKWEAVNNISVNVYGVEEKHAVLMRATKEKRERHVNLLLFENHYCWIKNFSRFMNNGDGHQKFFCESCGIGYTSEDLLAKHIKHACKPQFIEMPDPEKATVEFRNIAHQLACPLVIYADFESALEKSDMKRGDNTKILQTHKPIAYAFQTVARDDSTMQEFAMSVEDDAAMAFVQALIARATQYDEFIHRNVKPVKSSADWKSYKTAVDCHICRKPLGDDRVWDHNHTTGAYRGAAHSKCNVLYQMPDFVPVLFHNLMGYDGHFIFDAVARCTMDYKTISALPVSGEKFKALDIRVQTGTYTNKANEERPKFITFRFLDSMAFLNSSLEKLADTLTDDQKCFTRAAFPDDVRFDIMKRKGYFPYDAVSCLHDLDVAHLPRDEHPTMGKFNPDEYERGLSNWTAMGCLTLRDYLQVYLTADVKLLTDVFENFRTTALDFYRLDPCHYVSLPAMAWDAMLLMTGVQLDLTTDADIYAMLEKGKRGGVSFIGHRHAKANNRYMGDSFDASKPESYMMYLDANNLYGWAMCQHLPIGEYEWVEMTAEQLLAADPEGEFGYIAEVDMEYPRELHRNHQLLPLMPESRAVDDSELSDYQLGFNANNKNEKLISSLNDKTAYVSHYRNIRQAVSLGMRVKAVHRVIKFRQSQWLAPYIQFNNAQRIKARNDFEKDFFKLCNNAVFGKTMEDVRGRLKFEFIAADDEERLLKYTSKPTFIVEWEELHDLRALKMQVRTVRLNKPIAVGVSILELSKVHMFNFHYGVMLPRYGVENMKLCMTDTDSLFYHITTPDVYADMGEMREHFDLSEYHKSNPLYDATNKKVLGKFKDEAAGEIITEFVGLRAKLYAYRKHDGKEDKRCKGVSKSVVKDMKLVEYLRCLESGESKTATMTTINSRSHALETRCITKTALAAFDNKRKLLNAVNSVPFGYNP